MPRLLLITLLSVSVFLICCKSKTPEPETKEKYETTYKVGKIPGIDSFYILTDHEKQIDSLFTERQDTETYFKDNRSRVFMDSAPHNKVLESEQGMLAGSAMPCNCTIKSDTVFVDMFIGFFGGYGFSVRLFKDQFESAFYIYTDDTKPYKSSLSDTAFSEDLFAKSKYQTLVLDEKPSFKPDQQITGLLTYTSNTYYEQKIGNTVDSTYVTGKIYFTCKTKEYKERTWNK